MSPSIASWSRLGPEYGQAILPAQMLCDREVQNSSFLSSQKENASFGQSHLLLTTYYNKVWHFLIHPTIHKLNEVVVFPSGPAAASHGTNASERRGKSADASLAAH